MGDPWLGLEIVNLLFVLQGSQALPSYTITVIVPQWEINHFIQILIAGVKFYYFSDTPTNLEFNKPRLTSEYI